jgi:hypothetical protein
MIGNDIALGLSSRSRTLAESTFISRSVRKRFVAPEKPGRDAGLIRNVLPLAVTSSGDAVRVFTFDGYHRVSEFADEFLLLFCCRKCLR